MKLVLKESMRFAACFREVKNLNKSRNKKNDNVHLATAMFNKRTVSDPREDVGELFLFF